MNPKTIGSSEKGKYNLENGYRASDRRWGKGR